MTRPFQLGQAGSQRWSLACLRLSGLRLLESGRGDHTAAPRPGRLMAWDRVHTVTDYYDEPRRGIADVDGVPHIYEAEFDHSTAEYGDTYYVSPVDEDL